MLSTCIPMTGFWSLIYIYICKEDTAVLFSVNYPLLFFACAEIIYVMPFISPLHIQNSTYRDTGKPYSQDSDKCIAHNKEIQFTCQLFLCEHTVGRNLNHEMFQQNYVVNRAHVAKERVIWHCCLFPVQHCCTLTTYKTAENQVVSPAAHRIFVYYQF